MGCPDYPTAAAVTDIGFACSLLNSRKLADEIELGDPGLSFPTGNKQVEQD